MSKFPNEFPYTFSKIPLSYDLIEQHARRIYHVNGICGAGKTYTFEHKIALPHFKNHHNSVLIYAAPTEDLIEQEEVNLLKLGIPASHLFCLTSKTIKGRVADRLRDLLVGSKREGRAKLPDGSIVLVTHECLALTETDMPGKDRVVLVYDEARACLQDNYHVTLTKEVYEYLTTRQVHPVPDDLQDDVGATELCDTLIRPLEVPLPKLNKGDEYDAESISIWRWGNYSLDVPKRTLIHNLLPKTKDRDERAKDIVEFLEAVHSSSLDVYVSVHERKREGRTEYVVNNVYSPARMFRNYAKVLILSAFFESSQMFAFLDPVLQASLNQRDRKLRVCKDVTAKYLDKDRMVKLLNRLRNTYLTYIFDLDGRSLTKGEMQRGIVVDSLTDEQRKKINCAWQKACGSRPESYRTIWNEYENYGNRATHFHDDERAAAFKIMGQVNDNLMIQGSVIRYMTETAISIQQAFFRKYKMRCETLPVAITPRFNTGRKSDSKEIPLWKQEKLDDLNQEQCYDLPKNRQVLEQLPIVAHGMNRWQHLNSAAFLASMKYNQHEKNFLNKVIPGYRPEIDRTLDYALQILWRCSVRDAKNDDPCLLIVTDRELAEQLRVRFFELAKSYLGFDEEATGIDGKDDGTNFFPVKNPRVFLKGFETSSVLMYIGDNVESDRKYNQKRKFTVNGQVAQRLKQLYQQSEDGKQYSNLSNAIAYAKKTGKSVDALTQERSKFMTLAQWKKSVDGQRALAEMKEGPSTREKLIAVFQDAAIWADRGHNLSMLQAAKACGLAESEVNQYYPSDGFEKNWRSVRDWDKSAEPEKIILAAAKQRGVRF